MEMARFDVNTYTFIKLSTDSGN